MRPVGSGSVSRPSGAHDGRPQQSPGRVEAGAGLPPSASSTFVRFGHILIAQMARPYVPRCLRGRPNDQLPHPGAIKLDEGPRSVVWVVARGKVGSLPLDALRRVARADTVGEVVQHHLTPRGARRPPQNVPANIMTFLAKLPRNMVRFLAGWAHLTTEWGSLGAHDSGPQQSPGRAEAGAGLPSPASSVLKGIRGGI